MSIPWVEMDYSSRRPHWAKLSQERETEATLLLRYSDGGVRNPFCLGWVVQVRGGGVTL